MIKFFKNFKPEAAPFFMEALLVFATLSWGMAFIWIKQITDSGMDTNVFVFIRYGLALALMTPFCIKDMLNVTKKELSYGAIIGVLMYLSILFQTYGLKYTTPANSGFITTAYVVFVPFASWVILKKKPARGVIIAVLLCMAGLYVLSMGGESLQMNLGNFLTLMCAFCWGIQVPILSKAGRECRIKVLTFLPIVVMFIFSGVATAAMGGIRLEGVDTKAAILPIVMCALFPTLLAGFAQTYAQKYIDPSKAAIIYTLESVFACLFSIMLGMERMTLSLAAGGLMILAAIAINDYFSKRERRDEPKNEES